MSSKAAEETKEAGERSDRTGGEERCRRAMKEGPKVG